MGIFQKIGKWQTGSVAFAKVEFLPLPEGLSVRILKLDINGNIQSELKSFEDQFEFWSYAGLTLYWIAHMSYKYSHLEGAKSQIFEAVKLAIEEKPLPAEMQLGYEEIARMREKVPYLELIVSKATGGMDLLPYNLPIGTIALRIESAMLHSSIVHYLQLYPAGFNLLIKGLTELFRLHNEYPLTNHESGSRAAVMAMNTISEQLMAA